MIPNISFMLWILLLRLKKTNVFLSLPNHPPVWIRENIQSRIWIIRSLLQTEWRRGLQSRSLQSSVISASCWINANRARKVVDEYCSDTQSFSCSSRSDPWSGQRPLKCAMIGFECIGALCLKGGTDTLARLSSYRVRIALYICHVSIHSSVPLLSSLQVAVL